MRRTHQPARVAGFAVIAALAAGPAAGAAAAGPAPAAAPPGGPGAPVFRDGAGLQISGVDRASDRWIDVGLRTAAVRGPQRVRIELPPGYADHPERRYPVLYLLHGAGGQDGVWSRPVEGNLGQIAEAAQVITVMPTGGVKGWYANWLRPGRLAPQSWQTFHVDQLVPWVDQNLRTEATREGRAIAGISMGGFGAVRYAQARPDLFGFVSSLSGPLDLSNPLIRTVVTVEELTFGDPVAPGAIFGSTAPGLDRAWQASDPVRNADRLRNTSIVLYSGNGGGLDPVEAGAHLMTMAFHRRLMQRGIAHAMVDYGDGKGWGAPGSCKGGHAWPCWRTAMSDLYRRMQATMAPVDAGASPAAP